MSGVHKTFIHGITDHHMHSTCSDGEESPEELMAAASACGLRTISITDHNTFALTEPIHYKTMEVWPGCEFSAEYFSETGRDEVHIIGLFPYGVDSDDFSTLLSMAVKGKKQFLLSVLDFLKTKGIDISAEELFPSEGAAGIQNPGRVQIAGLIHKHGFTSSVDEAMDRYVGNFSPWYSEIRALRQRYVRYADFETVAREIAKHRGVPVLAHPFFYGRNLSGIEKMISEFASCLNGFRGGLEVYYQDYVDCAERISFLEAMAEKYHLVPTAASDRHHPWQSFAEYGSQEELEKMKQAAAWNAGRPG